MDAMVTARMPQRKKEEGNKILAELGTNPSQLINEIYDYLLAHRELPLQKKENKSFDREKLLEGIALLKNIQASVPERFRTMTNDEIRQERLISRGLATESDFE